MKYVRQNRNEKIKFQKSPYCMVGFTNMFSKQNQIMIITLSEEFIHLCSRHVFN